MSFMEEARNFFSQLKNDTLKAHIHIVERIIDGVKSEALKEISAAQDLEGIKKIQVSVFGKKGQITELSKNMGRLSPDDRPVLGKVLHDARSSIEEALNSKLAMLEQAAEDAKLKKEILDISLPGNRIAVGHKHPITMIEDEIKDIFRSIGYTVVEGFEIEEDYYNFERLNIPKDHPAREMQDTFYIDSEQVLRTHTSPVQARTMDKVSPQLPVKVISPGKVFRRDDDATHSPMFHQIEGLYIDKHITFAHLKGTLLHVLREIFGADREIRLRPSYFPFTEPSGEVDVSCGNCGGKGCRVCSHTGWLEILGSGMVHPKVLEMAGYDPNEVQGFAFGMGIERIAMLKYEINDIRLFYENDNRFLKQFGGI